MPPPPPPRSPEPATSAAEAPAASGRDYLELRTYRLKPGAEHALLDSYLEKALIPALNARGIGAVGVFTEPEAKDGPAVWVLIPHPSLDSVAAVTAGINADPAVQAAGAEYLTSPTKANPAFDRIDSWLHLAFAGLPRLAVPALATAGQAEGLRDAHLREPDASSRRSRRWTCSTRGRSASCRT